MVLRARRLETAVSFCILAVIVFISAVILFKQYCYTNVIPSCVAGKQAEITDMTGLAPDGFEPASKAEVYDAENLYEKIDGKAPLYTESGFKGLFCRRFAALDSKGLLIELCIYDMGGVKNAFSVYSTQMRQDAEILKGFAFAYRADNMACLIHGKYYVEITGLSESDKLIEAMNRIAVGITQQFSGGATEIAELALFPSEGLIAAGRKLYLKGAFGFTPMTDTFTAQYGYGSGTVTAFISVQPDGTATDKLAESYRKFLIDNGGVVKEAEDKSVKWTVIDIDGSVEIIFSVDRFVAGVHGADDAQAARKIAARLFSGLEGSR